MFAKSKTFAAAWVSVLALVSAACGEDAAKVDNLFLKITSDAPSAGGKLESLRILFVRGDVRFPADPNLSAFNPTLGELDPVASPVFLSVRYDGTTFGDDPSGVTLQVIGRIAGKPVTAFEAVVDIGENVILPVHLSALADNCDSDGDGFMDCSIAGCCASNSVLADCEPGAAGANPWGVEDDCNDTDDLDNDCKGGDAVPANADGDPVADCKETACGADSGRADVYPGAAEICDARDNDCDGSTDEGITLSTPAGPLALGATCGTGKCAGGAVQCSSSGGVECSTADLANANEGCDGADDGVDDDCDGLTDEGCEANIVDVDGDGVGNDLDCDDFDSGRYPGNLIPEGCCDPAAQSDDALRAACDHNCNLADTTFCEANDKDGDGYTVAEGDCDDDDRFTHPGAVEKCDDGIDQDCLLGDDTSCVGLTDGDGDGWPSTVDCDDDDEDIRPDAVETCNGKDDDCDSIVDNGNPDGGAACGTDEGECSVGVSVCVRAVTSELPCIDGGAAPCQACPNDVEPVIETCNGKDDDCNSETDETFKYTNIVIGDPCDGVGACGQGTVQCAVGDTTQATCSTNPNGSAPQVTTEVCDTLDNDCDGQTNESLTNVNDSDCNRRGVCGANLASVHALCLPGGGWSCDYTDVPAFEDDHETLCDGKDNDCDDGTDEDITFVDAQAVTRNVNQGCDGSDADSCANGISKCDPNDQKKAICDESNAQNQLEICDGLDNDCDGSIDEDFKAGAAQDPTKALAGAAFAADNGKYLTKPDGSAQTCGTGTCGVGSVICSTTNPTKLTCSTPSQPTTDFCDGLDNDCNGTVDDRYVAGGDIRYNGGPFIDNPDTATANDGDQGKFKGQSCGTGSCSGGVVICANPTELRCDKVPAVLAADVCDEIDNDCDGTTDDNFLSNAPTATKVTVQSALFATDNGKSKFASCGTGECSEGTVICNGAHTGLLCSTNVDAQTETCEGLDDSCNGSTDEGFANLDSDSQANCVDTDDDNDGVLDINDSCLLGVLGWTSNATTDHDGDGCKDDDAEDPDDDNDGVLDAFPDRCPKGNLNWTSSAASDYDLDGCQDLTGTDEDTDDDNDGVLDTGDTCARGEKGWISAKGTAQTLGTDWDQDGCRDSSEDTDDDNDSLADATDRCDPDATGTNDLGANGSIIGWTRTVGTTGTPGSDWDNDGCRDSDEDLDDDNDLIADATDRCDPDVNLPAGTDAGAVGSVKDWASAVGTGGVPGTDYDADGCQDANAEDGDDDNDGILDTPDKCDPDDIDVAGNDALMSVKNWVSAVGTGGVPGTDYDADGCKDEDASNEDPDDDNDGILDTPDKCDPDDIDVAGNDALMSVKIWVSAVGSGGVPGTDYDADGCKDEDASNEDPDDDNDGILDAADKCDPDDVDVAGNDALMSVKIWVSAVGTTGAPGTDYDADGCKDEDASNEDPDDDNDGKADTTDRCDPDATGTNDIGANTSIKGWTRSVGATTGADADYDDDGCQDSGEDLDDDNDGKSDATDRCDPDASGPTADTGAVASTKDWTRGVGVTSGTDADYDDDGCQDSGEDTDDDNDGKSDATDRCDPDASGPSADTGAVASTKDWTRGVGVTSGTDADYDDDGCQDSGEDTDDDNDGKSDATDRCDPDASGPSADTGAVASTKDWTRGVGVTSGTDADYDDDGCQDSGEDTDDDNDGKSDATDKCDPDASGPTGDTGAVASTKDWTRGVGVTSGTDADYDDDGCQDSGEDTDDDNDGKSDATDKCDPDASGPTGDTGAVASTKDWTPVANASSGTNADYDDDGCQDSGEDTDDDNDGKSDDLDLCDPDATGTGDTGSVASTKSWVRSVGSIVGADADYDDDGCQDPGEDTDDDNDGKADGTDICDPDNTGTGDLGANTSSKNWVRSVGTAGAALSDYDDDGCQDSNEDLDDDSDGKADDADRCDPDASGPTGDTGSVSSNKSWVRSVGTIGLALSDYDDDGCQDSNEDLDDDNDGKADDVDRCDPDASGPTADTGSVSSTKGWTRSVGTVGQTGSDYDDDGCEDAGEDVDDDNDGKPDTTDRCDPDPSGPLGDSGAASSSKDWTPSPGTVGLTGSDYDDDGCRDSDEDTDDDDDGKSDDVDRCDPDASGPTGDTGAVSSTKSWSRSIGTVGATDSDYDDDGCQDSGEDVDDDNDGKNDDVDRCDPDASGPTGDTGAVSSTKAWARSVGTIGTTDSDYDDDGCQDSGEDVDDDNDGKSDDVDRCDPDASGPAGDTGSVSSQKAWTRGVGTVGTTDSDYDDDGCRDSDEDLDDDNDGKADTGDRCDPDASGPTGDTGAVSSTKDWTRSVGTVGLSGSDYDDDGCEDAGEDTDDDNDGKTDDVDRCDPDGSGPAADTGAVSSNKDWTRSVGTVGQASSDYDDDGCLDSGEDVDDDNDGKNDNVDKCDPDASGPTGDTGAATSTTGTFTDYDSDGCAAAEDPDDDDDGILDAPDQCDASPLGWTSVTGPDLDSDGCKDDVEDDDDDGDGYKDEGEDLCPSGPAVNWLADSTTDYDADGCKDDQPEDNDDDNDGVVDGTDKCDPDNLGAGDPATMSTKNWDGSSRAADLDADGCKDADPGAEDTCVDADIDGWGRTGFPDSSCSKGTTDDCNDAAANVDDIDMDNICLPGDTCEDVDGDGWGRAGLNAGCEGAKAGVTDCDDAVNNVADNDHDNLCGVADNCPLVSNPDQANSDSDASGDLCDTCTDADADGFGRTGLDRSGCAGGANADCNDTAGNSDDLDHDNICDANARATCTSGGNSDCDDNCPALSNATQADANTNAIGDACDPCTAGNGEPFEVCGDCLDNDCNGTSDKNDTTCAYRRIIGIQTDASGVLAGHSISLSFDHHFLVATTQSAADAKGDDVRIYYRDPSTGTFTEIDRVVDPESAWDGPATKIWFKAQASIMADVSDGDEVNTDYYLYANVAGTAKKNENNVFQFADFFDRNDSTTVGAPGPQGSSGTAWTESETGSSTMAIAGNSLAYTIADENTRPIGYRTFPAITQGRWLWRTKWNWSRSSDNTFALYAQLGNSGASFNATPTVGATYPSSGVGPVVMWARNVFGSANSGTGDLGSSTGSAFTQVVDDFDGSDQVAVIVDVTAKTFNIDPNGDLAGFSSNINFNTAGLTQIDAIRMISHAQTSAGFPSKKFDYVMIQRMVPVGEFEPFAYVGVKEPLGPACIVGGGSLARYYLDDARDDALGASATTLSDSTATPLDLTRATAAGQPVLVEAGTQNGLYWDVEGSGGTASVPYTSTKLSAQATGLDDSTTATLEFVVEVYDTASESFMIDFQRTTAQHQLSVSMGTFGGATYQIKVYLNNAVIGAWTADITLMSRSVFTIVADTSQATAGNRLKLYRDGELQTLTNTATAVPQNTLIDVGDAGTLRVGNAASATASPWGLIYYTAIYRAALSDVQVRTNAQVLRADDDRR